MRSTLLAHWRRKVMLSAILTLAFCFPYFLLQHLVLVPVRQLPLSAADLAVEFSPHWVWVYQSVYLLVTIVPWFASSIEELDRYARGFLLQAYIGFAVFLFFPIAGPRPELTSSDPMFRLLTWYDSPLNAFPSLHVGLAVYSVLVAARLSSRRLPMTERVVAVSLAAFWCGEIAYAAVATKQHYVIDLPAGAVLAVLCFQWAWSFQPVLGTKFTFMGRAIR